MQGLKLMQGYIDFNNTGWSKYDVIYGFPFFVFIILPVGKVLQQCSDFPLHDFRVKIDPGEEECPNFAFPKTCKKQNKIRKL